MFGFLLTLMIIDAAVLFTVVLMQAGQGGGLASLGGGGVQAIGGRQATTILTKATWITGGIFMGLALILSAMPSSRSGASSELQQRLQEAGQVAPPAASPLEGTPPPATPAPTGGQPQ
jgi:preprotein translocase subunit SecG